MASSNKVFLAVIGTGGVGSHFLDQLLRLQSYYPHISLVLLSRSSKTLVAPSFDQPLQLSTWAQDLEKTTNRPFSPSQILSFLLSASSGSRVLVDNTSNQDIANAYPDFLRQGVSIVTPNKKAFSGDITLFRHLKAASHPQSPGGGLLYHESTVGAGLPIISTLNDLVTTGDKISKIEGVFSGTLSFLFNTFSPSASSGGGRKWSDIVKEAKEAGFTEPDPREDLNGLDVARKLVILARLSGVEVKETQSFPVESLIPGALEDESLSVEDFMAQLPAYDEEMEKVKQEAGREGKVVRYVGSLDVEKQELRVKMERFDRSHPIAGLKGSGNFVSFYTQRYGSDPLIVQGAGYVFPSDISAVHWGVPANSHTHSAGGAVTAMGVTADLIKILQRIS
ncbi:MAG: hypothetical protein LQ342_000045 [Letrouitia transgressa]|nr:MAG: hypothetical protein LQ342_000045 [Letrouitia transgressa]